MPSKRSKATDQKYISLAEFRKTKGLKKAVKKELRDGEHYALSMLAEKFGPRLVNRVRASAKRQKLSVCGLLAKLSAKA